MSILAQAAETASSGTAEAIVFWVFAVIGLGAGIAMVSMRNIVHGALMLVINFFAIAALFVTLESQFLGIVQIIVYAGAIMVLFLFVIMLLGVDRDDLVYESRTPLRIGAIALVLVIAGGLLYAFVGPYTGPESRCGSQAAAASDGLDPQAVPCLGLEDALAAEEQGSVSFVGNRLFTRYSFPFEASALLLTVATIGALVIGRRRDVDPADEPAYEPTAELPSSTEAEEAMAAVAALDQLGDHTSETGEPDDGDEGSDTRGEDV